MLFKNIYYKNYDLPTYSEVELVHCLKIVLTKTNNSIKIYSTGECKLNCKDNSLPTFLSNFFVIF